MMNMKKRFLALLLCVIMGISFLPGSAFAEEGVIVKDLNEDAICEASQEEPAAVMEEEGSVIKSQINDAPVDYEEVIEGNVDSTEEFSREADDVPQDHGACGKNLTWSVDDGDVLTITGTGKMTNYSADDPAPWKGRISAVIIEDGVTSIGDFAFFECERVRGVILARSVSEIGDNVFVGCVSMENIFYAGSEEEWSHIKIAGTNNTIITNVSLRYNNSVGFCAFANDTGCDTDTVAVKPGQTVTLHIDTGSIFGIYKYLWCDEDGNEISEATGADYTPQAITHNTEYTCIVYGYGSRTATVTFYVFVDNGLKAYVSGTTRTNIVISTVEGTTETLSVEASVESGEIFYQWYGLYSNPIVGATEATYFAEIDTDYAVYSCVVSDEFHNSVTVRFELRSNLVGLEVHPAPVTGYEYTVDDFELYVYVPYGKSVTLGAIATSDYGGIQYQWYLDSVYFPIEGATGAYYTVENAEEDHRYSCIVKDASGDQWDISCYVYVENTSSVLELNKKATVKIAKGGNYEEYSFTPKETKTYRFYSIADDDTYGSLYDSKGTLLTSDDNSGADSNFAIEKKLTAGAKYVLRAKYSDRNMTGRFKVMVTDDMLYAHAGDTEDSSEFVYAKAGTTVTLHVEADSTYSAVRYQWYDNDRSVIEGANEADFTTDVLTNVVSYSCYVSNDYNSAWVSFFVNIENSIHAYAEGTEEPYARVFVPLGETATLSVDAGAEYGSVSYQWCDEEGYSIDGATESSFTTEKITNHSYYSCIVTDDFGNSEIVGFDVYVENGLAAYVSGTTDTEVNIPAVVGKRETLSVDARVDSGEIFYQWYDFYGNAVAGATEAEYTTNEISGFTVYYCEVSDEFNNSVTVSFTLRTEFTYLYAQPSPVAGYDYISDDFDLYVGVPYGQSVTVGVEAHSDYGKLRYQWYLDNRDDPIDGATSASYTIDRVLEDHNYFCIVTDASGAQCDVSNHVSVENNSLVLVLNKQTKAAVKTAGDHPELLFSPEITALYRFSAISEKDTFGFLYDSDMNRLAMNDGGGEGRGFELEYTLRAGETYTLRTGFADSSKTGFYYVSVRLEHIHAPEKREAKEPTCEEAGNTEYWFCPECGRSFSDAEGSFEIDAEDRVIPALGHTYEETEWTWADDYSWATVTFTCLVCEKEITESVLVERQPAEEVRDAVQGLNTDDLAGALEEDEENSRVTELLAALDEQLGGTDIVVDETLSESFDQNEISVVGAALNTPEEAERSIGLVVGEAKNELEIPETSYEDPVTVTFSMTLENVGNTEQLAVPIKVILPCPENMDPAFLILYHYHENVEEPERLAFSTSNENGKTYISFVLTGFSDFAIVSELAEKLTLSEDNLILAAGKTDILNVTSNKGKTVTPTWSSSDPMIAAVSSKGMVTAKKVGKAVITATVGDIELACDVRVLFKDVTDYSLFYFDAVYNMVDQGVIGGYDDGTFKPNGNCNRAAVVTFLWRLAGKPEPTKIATFSDMTDNAEFNKAISWAAEEGITSGWSDNTFRPWNTCNRAAIVTFLWRYAGKSEPSEIADFKDMPTDNEDFCKAISWAAENGITTGWDDNTFRPWNTCNRLAVASFLDRYTG